MTLPACDLSWVPEEKEDRMTSNIKLAAPRTLLVAALALNACGNLTEGNIDEPIGALTLVSTDSSPSMPVAATATPESITGSGSIGAVTIVNFPLGFGTYDIAIAPDGTPWFQGNSIMHVASDDTVSAVPYGGGPSGLVFDGKGALWQNGLCRFDITSQQFQTYTVPAPLSRPTSIAADDQGNIWLTGGDSNVVGRLDASNRVYVVANEAAPTPITVTLGGLALSSDGQVFVSDYAQGRIGRVQAAQFAWTDLGGDLNAPSGLTAGDDGAIWFVSLGHPNEVGHVDRDGSLHAFSLPDWPSPLSDKSGSRIVRGPDGAFWFTLMERHQLGRVDANGDLSFIQLVDTRYPVALAFDPAGRLWFTYDGGIARVEF
jgi:virginiamycin B lyase